MNGMDFVTDMILDWRIVLKSSHPTMASSTGSYVPTYLGRSSVASSKQLYELGTPVAPGTYEFGEVFSLVNHGARQHLALRA